ncbi:MAG: hypothetical protein ABIK28_17890 [Planctomycetota bacterium]
MKNFCHGLILVSLFAACSPEEGDPKGDQGISPTFVSQFPASGSPAPAEQGAASRSVRAGQAGPVIQAGAEFLIVRTAAVKGNLRPQGSVQAFPLNFFQQLEYTDQVLDVKERRIHEVLRHVHKAETRNMDPETRRTETRQMVHSGSVFCVEHTGSGSNLYDQNTKQQVWNEELIDAFARCTAPRLWPESPLSKGQCWSYSGRDLEERICLIDIQGGKMDLNVERIGAEPTTRLETAYIRGTLETKIDLEDGLMADFSAHVEIDLPLSLGVPFRVKFEGRLSGQGSMQDDWGQPLVLKIEGEGTLLQICKPAAAVLDSKGAPALDQAPTGTDPRPVTRTPTGTSTGRSVAESYEGAPGTETQTMRFHRTAEPKESAFSLLIPSGWQVEGGILRIDPSAQGGAAQSIEAKLDFTVKCDDAGTVMIRWTPELVFKDARNMPARQMGMFPDGSNYMGMTVWPLLSSKDYLQQVLFPQAHPQAQDVRIEEVRALPRLADAFSEALRATFPGVGFTYDAALMTVTYREKGMLFKELLVTAIENWGSLDAWKNKTTFYLRAPAGEFKKWEPVFSVIQRSVILNMQWAVGELKGQIERGKIAGKTYEEMQRIGREITQNHQKTNAEIHNDMFLTLTDQEEYVNPFTNEVEIGSNQWKHLWTDQNGDVIYTNNESYDPNTDPDLNLSGFRRAKVH